MTDESILKDGRRYVFLSAGFLSKQYKSIPSEVLNNSIFIFNAQRNWIFPATNQERLEAKSIYTNYAEFDEDYKSIILLKEKQNLVYWLLPNKDYQELSIFLESIVDSTANEKYLPLILDEAWWQSEFSRGDAKYTKDTQQIVNTFKTGSFDYDAVMELVYQSNPTLVPVLYWSES